MSSRNCEVLIEKNDNNLKINERALRFIERLEGPICPVVIIGQYRTGKSYLLSRLFESKFPFVVGHTDQPQTKGIWLSTELIKVESKSLKKQMNLLLIDTEGLESFESDDKWDTNLFLASLLLSSALIYNTKNALAKDALNKLSVASCISEKIKFNSKLPAALNHKKLKEQGPDLFWIVRDFSLKTTKPAQEEFEAILEHEDVDSVTGTQKKKEIANRNEVRSNLQNAFFTLNCAYLPSPELRKTSKLDLDREELLQQLDKIEDKDLSEKFLSKLTEVRDQIKATLRPKKVDDQYLDGPKYAEFIKHIVHAINKEQTFCLQDVMLNIARAEADKLLAKLRQEYENNVDALVNKKTDQPFSINEFEEREKMIYDACIADLNKSLAYNSSLQSEYVKRFDDERKTVKQRHYKRLLENIKTHDKKILNILWSRKMASKSARGNPKYESVNQFDLDLAELKMQFKKYVIQPEFLEEIWLEFNKDIDTSALRIDIQKEIANRAERERLEKERKEKERQEVERYERERQERERRAKEEQERYEREKQAREKQEREEQERYERLRQQRAMAQVQSFSDCGACSSQEFPISSQLEDLFRYMSPRSSSSSRSSGNPFGGTASSSRSSGNPFAGTSIGTRDFARAGTREVFQGPRGGQYYVNDNGNRTYLRK